MVVAVVMVGGEEEGGRSERGPAWIVEGAEEEKIDGGAT